MNPSLYEVCTMKDQAESESTKCRTHCPCSFPAPQHPKQEAPLSGRYFKLTTTELCLSHLLSLKAWRIDNDLNIYFNQTLEVKLTAAAACWQEGRGFEAMTQPAAGCNLKAEIPSARTVGHSEPVTALKGIVCLLLDFLQHSHK